MPRTTAADRQPKPSLPPVPLVGEDYPRLKLPQGYLSFSQIDAYLQCPTKYWFNYFSNRPKAYTSAMAEGQAMSLTMEQVGLQIINGEHPTKAMLTFAGKTHTKFWKEEAKKVTVWMQGDSVRTTSERAKHFLKLFWDEEIHRIKPKAVEKKIDVCIAGVPIEGYIDLVEEGFVGDYKVSASARYYKPATSLQLALYAVAENLKGNPVTKVFYYVFEKKTGKLVYDWAELDLDQIRRIVEYKVATVAYGITHGVFPPCRQEDNFFCSPQWCEHWQACPAVIK